MDAKSRHAGTVSTASQRVNIAEPPNSSIIAPEAIARNPSHLLIATRPCGGNPEANMNAP
ncbi:hypothetical protein Thimo_0858 [Thioflavicoccus mobilis 8321]|uniref:Uncharacterized protein n=1 Tax=Thioflavicoccus mobilis 8321 TaxID=765912 RepID=L0GWL6_9GAMM|nr:hypothetical protein [Thioflavicoccus mobilis]AGA89694.1 hypothetical protein Thimo_0858 [Thioflavicoccus mobilis 8321]